MPPDTPAADLSRNNSFSTCSTDDSMSDESSLDQVKKKILCVGLCRTDIIQVCEEFPNQYSEIDCIDCRWQRGGNASITCTVLALMDVEVEFLGTLSGMEPRLYDLVGDMAQHQIGYAHCQTIAGVASPISSIIVNNFNRSRTICNYNPNLPELTITQFNDLDLSDYNWIHFEGRNVNNVVDMMQAINIYNTRLRNTHNDQSGVIYNPIVISLEVNNDIPGILKLLPFADVIFIGEKFMRSRSINMVGTLNYVMQVGVKPEAIIICAYDERGALCRTPSGEYVQCPAVPSIPIVDIYGASDTFNAGIIYFLWQENVNMRHEYDCHAVMERMRLRRPNPLEFIVPRILEQALVFACRLAGAKMGFKGFSQLRSLYETLLIHQPLML